MKQAWQNWKIYRCWERKKNIKPLFIYLFVLDQRH